MPRKPAITLIGPGNLGSALGLALHRAGYRIGEMVTRAAADAQVRALARRVEARAMPAARATFADPVVWICVQDSAIAPLAADLARRGNWKGKLVLHSSGALGSRELAPLRKAGAAVASAHPMMSFVRGVEPDWRGVPFALEGDARAVAFARRVARELGGTSFILAAKAKPLYHAFGAFASPLVVAELAVMEKVAASAGLSVHDARRAIVPILRQTLRNYERGGPAGAFSGPLVRGDVATVRRHLQELKRIPLARQVYVALARAALRTLPVRARQDMERLLGDGT